MGVILISTTTIPADSSKATKYMAGNCLDQGKGGSLSIAQAMKLSSCEANIRISCFIKSGNLIVEYAAPKETPDEFSLRFSGKNG